MPGGDGTGPLGLGPMTGRAAGFCAGYPVPGYMNPIPGRGGFGRGFGFGRGRGWRHWYWATGLPGWARAGYGFPAFGGWLNPYYYPYYYGVSYGNPYAPQVTPQQQADMLKEQVKAMQQEINAINEQISTLEKTAAEEKK